MERIVLAIFFGLVGVLNLTAQNDCVTKIDTLEKKVVHSQICGNEIVDTLKVYDLKGRLTAGSILVLKTTQMSSLNLGVNFTEVY